MSADIEEMMKRVTGSDGVKGVIIMNTLGIPIRSTIENNEETVKYTSLISSLLLKTESALNNLYTRTSSLGHRHYHHGNSPPLSVFRLRTKLHEIVVTPVRDFIMITIQQPEF
mmetsp:Transcript_6162/g.8966  ORF Transcript_6162/g.8966 Transcript_6162/m.8966 type:complete len:113 (+) Transcript_6162:26-364(+)